MSYHSIALTRSVLLHVALSVVLFKYLLFCMFLAHGVGKVRTLGKCSSLCLELETSFEMFL